MQNTAELLRDTLRDCNARRRAADAGPTVEALQMVLHAATPPRANTVRPPPTTGPDLTYLPATDPPAALPPQIACSNKCSRQPRTRAGPAGSSGSIAQDKLAESDRCVAFCVGR